LVRALKVVLGTCLKLPGRGTRSPRVDAPCASRCPLLPGRATIVSACGLALLLRARHARAAGPARATPLRSRLSAGLRSLADWHEVAVGLANSGCWLSRLEGASRPSRLGKLAKPTGLAHQWLAIFSTYFVRCFVAPSDLQRVQDVYNLFMVPGTVLGYFWVSTQSCLKLFSAYCLPPFVNV
jgi:hypothetical protein